MTDSEGVGLRQRAIRGSAWALTGYGVSQLLRLASNLILTRLLFPEAFGLMALVMVFMQGLQMFSDVGIRPSIIHSDRGDDPVFLNTAWTIQVVRGFLLSMAALVGAWPFARLYGEPGLMILIPVAGIGAAISGFNSSKIATSGRHLALGRLTLIDLVAQVVGVSTMIAGALIWHSIWSLVIGGLIGTVAKAILSHVILPGVGNRLCWDRQAATDLFSFGRWIFVSTMLTFGAMQADRLLLGAMAPLDVLGVYSIALVLAAMLKGLTAQLTDAVLFPALASHRRRQTADLLTQLHTGRGVILSAILPLTLGLILFAPLFFTTLYDPRYHQAGWMAQLASISIWFSILQHSSDRALLALGRSLPLAMANLINLVVTIPLCLLGAWLGGIAGLLVGFGLGTMAGHVTIEVAMSRAGLPIWRQDLRFTLGLGALVFIGLVVPMISGENGSQLTPGSLSVLLKVIAVGVAAIVSVRKIMPALASR